MDNQFQIKSYSKDELRELYDVNIKTWRRWLNKIEQYLPGYSKNQKFLTPAQVKEIVNRLGEP